VTTSWRVPSWSPTMASPSTRHPRTSGPGWCRWDGDAVVGTPLAGSTACCFLPTDPAPPRSSPTSRASRSATSSRTVRRAPRRGSSSSGWSRTERWCCTRPATCRRAGAITVVLFWTGHGSSPCPPLDGGRRTRYLFRSRWITSPWWFTLGGRLGIVPADFVMSRDHLRGVKARAEGLARSAPATVAA
jgi:hypothetical protein